MRRVGKRHLESKIKQMELLMYYLPFCETMSEKYAIEDEIHRIQYLIKNIEDVKFLKMTVESKLNVIKIEEYAESLER